MRLFSSALCITFALTATALADPPADVMKPIALEQNERGGRLHIQVTAAGNGCTWGDFDAIELDLKHAKIPRLLVSLEPLGDSNFPPMVSDISSFDLGKGFVSTYQLPKFSKPTHLAFYICKDSEKKNRCSDKPVVDLQGLLNIYLTPTGALRKAPGETGETVEAADKTYYFAYLLADGNHVYVLKNQPTPADYAKLESYTRSIGSAGIAKLVDEKSNETHSVQPEVKNDILSLTLPRLNKAECKAGK